MDQDLSAFQKRKKRRGVVRWILLGLLILAFLVGVFLALDKWYFRVRKVTVSSPSVLYTEDQLVAACPVEEGSRLLGVHKGAIKEAIEENFPFLTKVEVKLRLPDTVVISFEEKMGQIALTLGEETFAVDADLTVLARIDPEEKASRLGLMTEGVSRCVVGEKIEFFDKGVPEILSELVVALDQAGLLGTVRSLDLRDKFDLRLDYDGRFLVKLGERDDVDLKLAMVKRVMAEMTAEDTGEIDISDPNNAYVRKVNRG